MHKITSKVSLLFIILNSSVLPVVTGKLDATANKPGSGHLHGEERYKS